MKKRFCNKVFSEIAVSPDGRGKPNFSLCCYMHKHAWFSASSIAEALTGSMAQRIRENAVDNCHGFCPDSCPNWQEVDHVDLPEVVVTRFELAASTRCNARCVFCFQADYDLTLPQEIIEEWRRDYLPHLKHAVFGGGEPLLVAFPLIQEVAEKRPDASIALVTNGILLDKIIPFRDKISGINISLNSGSRDVYKAVMKVDAFDKVVGNIKALRSAGYTGPISSTYVICRENVEDIHNFLRLCKETGITKAGFNVDKTDPGFNVAPDLSRDIQAFAKEIGVKVSLGIMNNDASLLGRFKQVVLYYLRYRKRRIRNE